MNIFWILTAIPWVLFTVIFCFMKWLHCLHCCHYKKNTFVENFLKDGLKGEGRQNKKKLFLSSLFFVSFVFLFHGRSAFNGAHSFIAWSWESVSLFWYSPQQTHSSESQTSQTDTKLNMLVTWVSHSALFHDGLKVVIICKIYKRKHSKEHCQRQNRPKALSTLTHLQPLVQSRSFKKEV